jgi:hypothetical protein
MLRDSFKIELPMISCEMAQLVAQVRHDRAETQGVD